MKLVYRPEIDGLRAIAVGAVILYHAQITILGYQPFKGGFIGVDIFFVISGYLITSLILKELVTTGTFSFKHFYERRIRRILPVLLFVMLVSLPFAWIYLLPVNFLDFSKSIIFSLGFSSNFYFNYSGLQYGNFNGLFKPFLHTWSLSIEEQFYILFPIILLITFKYFKKYLIHTLLISFVISLGLADWSSRNYSEVSFYFLHTRMWELLAGSILAYFEITNGHRSQNQRLNLILPTIGLLLIGHSILFYNDEMFHPSFYTLSPIIGVCLIIWFSNKKDELITKILSTKLFVGIVLISYSLYLWHYPIFSFIRYYKSFYQNTEFINFLKYFSILLIILFSILSYSFVEKKFRNKKFKFKKIFLILSICSLILIIYNFTIIFYDGYKTRFHPLIYKYNDEHKEFEVKYNYQNFSTKKNVFIIGNSYADNLLNILWNNKTLEKKYYFYTAVADDIGKFQLECLKDFIEKKTNNCEGNFFNFFGEQYKKSNYIILSMRYNSFYLEDRFIETLKLLDADNKKFIIFLNDLHYADILDRYILINNKTPSFNKLEELEKEFFKKTKNYEKNIIQLVKDKFKKNNIKYVTRSEIFCNYKEKKCPLIKNENKIFTDSGHLTNNGAKYASNKIEILVEKLLD